MQETNNSLIPQLPEDPPKFNLNAFIVENKWALWLITASLVLIGIAAYFAFRKPANNTPVQPNVQISIDAPSEISSGSEVVYKVHVKNGDSHSIKDINIGMVYPNGFSYTDATPKPTKLNGTQFSLPSMDPGQDTIVMIKGDIQGNAGETKTISASMHYTLVGFSSDYVAQAQAQSQITTQNLALEFQGPVSINNNQDTSYSLDYSNYTDKQISGLSITLTTPQAFSVTGSDPKPNFGSTYQLGILNPGTSGKITISGSFVGANLGDDQVFTAKAEGSVDGNPSYALSTGELHVTVSQVPLEAVISLQSSATSVAPGDTLQYKIAYKNNGNSQARGVIINAKVSGEALDIDHISASGANVNGSTITWDASQNPDLEALGAGKGGTLDFTVSVKNPATRGTSKNLTATAHTEILSNDYKQPFVGADLVTKVKTVASISTNASYVSGPSLTVGQTTTYLLTITLKNETNDVTGGKMTFSLPNAVAVNTAGIDASEKANVTYDPGTKKITWVVDKIPAHAGSFVPPRKLSVQVNVKPGSNSKGQPLDIATNIKFNATDSFTTEAISLTAPAVKSIETVQ